MEKYHKSQFMKDIQMNNGILDFNNGVALYKKYLQTPQLNWDKEMRRPVSNNTFQAMCETHEKLGKDPVPLINQTVAAGGRLLFWSDLHFYHNNIIKYANRPFEGTDHMNQQLIKNYWENVTDKDIVVFGGDVAFGSVKDVIEIMKDLPGKKVLVLGNHDFDKNKSVYRDYHCFDVVTLAFTMQRVINGNTYNILVTHYPVHADVLPQNTINLHGHTHDNESGDKQINMSVEHTGFKPVSMEHAFEEEIKQLK
jgi:calcineurin-like phosphoesterase family protein